MIRAFKLEWLKVRHYRIFWILFGLYLLVQLFITNGGVLVLEWLESRGADFNGIKPSIIPIYDFPDIWQNTTWLGTWVNVLISFIVIVSVNNELTYNTLRQNIIDGVSKKEFLLSKFSLILFLALVCTLVLFLSGLATGFVYSHVTDFRYVFDELEFILAYFIQLVTINMFAFCVALVIKKAGFAIVFLFLYSSFFEPVLTTIMTYAPFAKPIAPPLVKFFPIYASRNLIDVPFPRYVLQEVNTDIFWHEWAIAFGWIIVYCLFITYILSKRDLKA